MKLASAFLLGLAAAVAALAVDAPPQKTVLTADHSEFVTDKAETHFTFYGTPQKRVTLTGTNLEIVCDYLEIIAVSAGAKSNPGSTVPTLDKFKYLLATGNVRIVQGDREATCGRAEVFPRDDKIELTDKPVIIDHSADVTTGGVVDHTTDKKSTGSKITMLRGEQRVLIENTRFEGPELKDLGPKATPPAGTPAPAAK